MTLSIKFSIVEEGGRYPTMAHEGDAGLDLYSTSDFILHPGDVTAIPTGIHVDFPFGYYGMIVPRSSMGAKGIIIPNSPGIIDETYPGTLKVLLLNLNTSRNFEIKAGDRIAQLLIMKKEYIPYEDLAGNRLDVSKAVRIGGFGSSGV